MPQRITVTLEEDQYTALMEIAEDEGRGLSDIIREALGGIIASRWPQSIGDTAREAIERGMTNQEALQYVLERRPGAMTTPSSIAWYRTQLRKENPEIKSDARIRADRLKARAKKQKK